MVKKTNARGSARGGLPRAARGARDGGGAGAGGKTPPPACGDAVGPLHQPAAGPPPSAGIPPNVVRQSLEARSARPGEELRITPGKNRLSQVRRTGGRKLFDDQRRAVFLEWLAATCNICLSAEMAGVAYQTPFKHRRKDPGFEAQWDEAIAEGYPRLEARLLQEAHRPAIAAGPSTIASSGNGPPPPGELGEEYFDPQLALTLLREHARRLPGSPDKRKQQRYARRVASNDEMIAALEKRLRGFALRQRKKRKKG